MSELTDALRRRIYDAAGGVPVRLPAAEWKAIARTLERADQEIERLHSWAGLMSVLDEHYPADVFDGSSGDPGACIVCLLREINELKAAALAEEVNAS